MSITAKKRDNNKENQPQEPFSIYIHFPYCKSRCPYCDFFRAIKPKDFDETAFVNRYIADLDYFAPYLTNRAVKSVFFGGGTPSLLSPLAIEQVLNAISQRFSLFPQTEISLEANPNTYEQQKFMDFRRAGINRLSLGVQALSAAGLKFLGRTHSLNDALQAIETGISSFPKFSLDLIYARPNQQWADWQQELDLALSFDPKHLSLYQLSIEENTLFYRKNIQPLDDETAVTLYNQTISYLQSHSLLRYEVSNFAASGQESVHNLVYWQGGDYIGLGEGAHGRFQHQSKLYASVDGRICETLSPRERAEELLLMGLRITSGINFSAFHRACGIDFFDFINRQRLQNLLDEQLLTLSETNVCLTSAGFLLLDEVIRQLVSKS